MENTLKSLFLAGRHADVLSRSVLDEGARFSPDETTYVVASLAALGQVGDAELLMRHQGELLSPEDQLFAHVHIGVASVNSGRYATARRHLGAAASRRDATSDPESLFFLYYSLAQYRYATGRLTPAMTNAHRAGIFLRRAPRDYPQLLGQELNGHLKAVTGDARAAIAHLQSAIDHAEKLGRHDHARQLGTTMLLYEARYVLKPKDAVMKLRLAAAQLAETDVFPRASLQMEIARQQITRHRIDDARAALEKTVRGLAGLGHRRYEAMASLRFIDLNLATGNFAEALLLVESVARTLDPEADDLLAYELSLRRISALARLAEDGEEPSSLSRVKAALKNAKHRSTGLARRTGFLPPSAPKSRPKRHDPGLNHRQVSLLSDLEARATIDVQAYKKRFDVSEITACRDLASLMRGGHLVRLGKARATRYVRPDA